MATTAPAPQTTNGTSKFTPGFQPEVIALKSTEGKPVTSRFNGQQICFSLTDGRRWYADPIIAQKIEQLRIQPGEFFQVCKSATRRGDRCIEQIEVEYLKKPAGSSGGEDPAGLNQETTTAIGRGASSLESNYSNPSTARASAPATTTAVPMNGKGETSAVQLARCYREAVDIAILTVEYSKKVGLSVAPCFEDIRCMAATLCINEAGRRP